MRIKMGQMKTSANTSVPWLMGKVEIKLTSAFRDCVCTLNCFGVFGFSHAKIIDLLFMVGILVHIL
jgi:hypothetical protein